MESRKAAAAGEHTPFVERAARMGLMAFGLVLACELLELGMRRGVSFAGPRPISASDDRGTILTLSDSHNYGVFHHPGELYPSQPQVLLGTRVPGRHNLGC